MKKNDLLRAVKQAILQQAIQGKLTADWREQNPNTEPASELLQRIKAEKEKLIKEKKIRKEKPLPPITEEETPFELPKGWVWCRLGEIIINSENLNIHKELPKSELINYVDIDAIDNKLHKIREPKLLPVNQLSSRARRVLKKGDIMYSLVRPYLNNLAIIEDEKENYIGSTGFAVFDCLFTDNKYVFWLLLTKYIENIYLRFMDGFNSPSITHDQFKNTIIPLPPLAEQKAIVEKVEALMQQLEMVDRGESIENSPVIHPQARKLIELYDKINITINEIQTQKQLVTELKQSILQEAIQGKLTADWREQNPNTEPASELLKRIKVEKEKLIKEKKIRKEKPLPPITEEEIPFELPKGWVWCRLGEIYQSTSGGTPTRGNHEYWNGNIYWYKSGELNDGMLENPSKEFITEKGLKESSATLFPKGTLLIAMYGATAGKLAILNVEATTNQAVCGFYKNEKVSTQYLFNYLLANRSKMIKESWGMSQPNISQTYLRNFVFALPPLAEQKAIVEKVEALMQKVSAMEEEINKSEQNAEMLMQAVLKEAFEGRKEEVGV